MISSFRDLKLYQAAFELQQDVFEITNPGTFHFGITPEKLMEPHESRPWNPIIANVFYRAGIIERWGSGTLNIIDRCAENGNPPPTWMEQAGSIFVTFTPAITENEPEVTEHIGTQLGLRRDQVTGEVTPEVTPEVRRMLAVIPGR